jgi:prolipoprotein diacylglyceryl transferase
VIVASLLGSIPSPSSGVLEIGPLSIHAYGLMIALGVVAGVWLSGRRLEERHVGTRDDMSAIAVWAVIAGVIGARLYHVITDWSTFRGDYLRTVEIWKGGLGIPGGLLAGITVGLWRARTRGIPPAVMATCAAPALPLAQAIGRLGNWFNQELFGKPTTLPWGLKISADKTLAAGYPPGTLFQPTFLYEMLWNLALCVVLLWIDRRWRPRPGNLMAIYVIGYGIGRFWVEGLRIDTAHHIAGLRLNQWTSILAIVGAAAFLLWTAGRPVVAVDPTFDGSDGDLVDGDLEPDAGVAAEPDADADADPHADVPVED